MLNDTGMIEVNKIYHSDWMQNGLPDKSVQLIIADPPYFEVKGDFDFVWKSFDDYLKDVEKWAIECKRLLAENGTIYWFGGSKKIAYTQVVFDKYFGLVNNLVWEKAESDGLFGSTGSEQLRSYPNSTERLLMYSNEGFETNLNEKYDYQIGLNRVSVMSPIISYFKGEQQRKGISIKEINEATNTAMGSIWFTHPSQWQLATKDWYLRLREIFGEGYFVREYEDLRREYEDLRRPFKNIMKSTEILKVRFKPSEYDHPTVKPESLAKLLILTSSRPNDLVLVPFAGSGTECAMSAKEGRRFIGFDVNPEYVAMATKRCNYILSSPTLF